MEHYIDIQLKPDAEMRENVLLNKVYTKFHKALSSMSVRDIGVSFPNCRITLGGLIRIHGSESGLSGLQTTQWLGGLTSYCKVSSVQAVPNDVSYRTISRKQSNMTASKLRRLVKRGSISLEDEKKYKSKMFSKGLDNPYLEIESASNGNKYRRFIMFGKIVKENTPGKFDSFGLSKGATIPWF